MCRSPANTTFGHCSFAKPYETTVPFLVLHSFSIPSRSTNVLRLSRNRLHNDMRTLSALTQLRVLFVWVISLKTEFRIWLCLAAFPLRRYVYFLKDSLTINLMLHSIRGFRSSLNGPRSNRRWHLANSWQVDCECDCEGG